MAVTSRDLRTIERRPLVLLRSGGVNSFAYLVTGVLALLAVYVLLSHILAWSHTTFDDLRYGRPRTYHLTGAVGPGNEAGALGHFIAMNLDRQIVVMYLPGGDAAQARTLPGPYLFGEREDLTPVTLRLADVNNDATPDLIARVKNEEIVYMNRGGNFELITPEERQHLVNQHGMP